jgi:hypothetical protein
MQRVRIDGNRLMEFHTSCGASGQEAPAAPPSAAPSPMVSGDYNTLSAHLRAGRPGVRRHAVPRAAGNTT